MGAWSALATIVLVVGGLVWRRQSMTGEQRAADEALEEDLHVW